MFVNKLHLYFFCNKIIYSILLIYILYSYLRVTYMYERDWDVCFQLVAYVKRLIQRTTYTNHGGITVQRHHKYIDLKSRLIIEWTTFTFGQWCLPSCGVCQADPAQFVQHQISTAQFVQHQNSTAQFVQHQIYTFQNKL